jgi:DNA-directed RNA polymerase subunit M/transcription elongation factor TFIIS
MEGGQEMTMLVYCPECGKRWEIQSHPAICPSCGYERKAERTHLENRFQELLKENECLRNVVNMDEILESISIDLSVEVTLRQLIQQINRLTERLNELEAVKK